MLRILAVASLVEPHCEQDAQATAYPGSRQQPPTGNHERHYQSSAVFETDA